VYVSLPALLGLFKSHIAVVLLLLFGITLLPYNFLHHHAEDEHGLMLSGHIHEEEHHCELDELFCQPNAEHCSHDQHISKTIAKCFSCEFHFIKHFDKDNITFSCLSTEYLNKYSSNYSAQLHEALILLSNKGPPTQFT
jgi:hypothetical protein